MSVKRRRGRPVQYPLPARIPDTPENVLKAVLAGPPKKHWDYIRKSGRKTRRQ